MNDNRRNQSAEDSIEITRNVSFTENAREIIEKNGIDSVTVDLIQRGGG
ncbi:hypothetical protein SAMN04488692_10556 [Halarsenatibacter silvermanii]|uniref:Uncharacterized protein n=3 Tax=Halarsenatibacter silvermanii TaxID=321763 RepID=A0A1G9KML2_9FIRM|nr:hypothetical protein [Halarsenatibacter silvermanii]SDL50744.1 hypothetical protein SAMN04488692_10556 [Halarsenatibacter silvermanii]